MPDCRAGRPSYYTCLGVSPGATSRALAEAFRGWQARHDAGDAAEEEFRRAEEAFCVLSDPGARMRHDRQIGLGVHPAWSPGPRAARRRIRAALRELARGRSKRALSLLEEAVRCAPGDPEARSWLGLVQARTGGCLHEAARNAAYAASQRPARPEFLFHFAEICSRAGQSARARRLRARAWVATVAGVFRRKECDSAHRAAR